MADNRIITINNVELSRNMTVDYEKGDPVINSVFKKFDTDFNKILDDKEWAKVLEYNEKLTKRKQEIAELEKNNKVISYYEKKSIKLQEKLETLWQQIDEIPNEFNKLLAFEEKHSNLSREGVKNKKDIPQGAFEYDISSFEMGIYDENKGAFTGESYKMGYIKGFETLTEDEQQEYKQLLNSAVKYIDKVKSLIDKTEKIDTEIDKNLALKDMANTGLIKKVGSSEYENQMYQKYCEVRNQSNPFLSQIQEYEQKYNQLSKKAPRSEDENKLLEQYKIQINTLKEVSKKWSISDLPENEKIEAIEQGFSITDASEQFTYNNEAKTEKCTNTHSVGLQYNSANWNVSANLEQAQVYKSGESVEDTFSANLSEKYSKGNYSLSSQTSFSTDSFSTNFNQTIGVNYNHLGLDYTKSFMTMKSDEETTTSTSDRIGISYQTGKLNNNASVTFAPDGTNYSVGSNISLGLQPIKNLNLNIMPSTNLSYNNSNETYTLNPSLTAMANYSNKGFNANMMLIENYSSTLSDGSRPQNTNMLMANGGVSFKGFGTNLKFTDMDTPFNHSDTYGAEVYYNNPKAGRLAVEYNYQVSNAKMEPTIIETSTLMAKYSLPLDTINSWFKKQ